MSTSKPNVVDVRKCVEKWDTYYTLKPLIFMLRFFGLNCTYKEGAVLKNDWSWLKIILLILFCGVVNALNIYHIIIWEGKIYLSFSGIIQLLFVLGYLQYLMDLFIVHKYGRDKFLQYLIVYEDFDKLLGMAYYIEIRRSIMQLLVFIASINIATAVIDFITWCSNYGVMIIPALIIDYFYVVLKSLSIIDVIAQITQVSYRLRGIGDLLKGFYLVNETLPGIKDVVLERERIKKVERVKISFNPGTVRTIEQFEFLIPKLNTCYLMILEQGDFINTTYGVRILWTSLTSFVNMIVLLNVVARIVMGSLGDTYKSISLVVFSSLMKLLAIALALIFEVCTCEQNYTQIKRIIRYIDYILVNKKISLHTRVHLDSFRSLVLSRSLQFQAVRFYNLNCALLLSIASAVVTYTLILLQHMN